MKATGFIGRTIFQRSNENEVQWRPRPTSPKLVAAFEEIAFVKNSWRDRKLIRATVSRWMLLATIPTEAEIHHQFLFTWEFPALLLTPIGQIPNLNLLTRFSKLQFHSNDFDFIPPPGQIYLSWKQFIFW